MTPTVSELRQHILHIAQAALHASDAGTLVRRALDDPGLAIRLRAAAAVDVIAAGKAAYAMRDAFTAEALASLRIIMATGPETGHPLPNEASVAAARQALAVAGRAADTDLVVVLLSGGASAKLSLPADGITLAEKQATVQRLLLNGADIYALNTVRKHLSGIKGGQLAASTPARMLTLVVSDVIGDDLSMIASGPTVPDDTTFAQALAVVDAHGGRSAYPASVVARLERGANGDIAETPKPGDPRFAGSSTRIIGSRMTAVEGARGAAAALGFDVHVIDEPVVGEARVAATHVVEMARARRGARPLCLIASGETTVRVTGSGKGGRNQEMALAMLASLETLGAAAVASSIGTDGIDGPTDAAGAVVDSSTAARAAAAGLVPAAYLNDNNAYAFFDRLGDLIRTGPTTTNVGDLQIILTT